MKFRYVEWFGGIGAATQALKQIGVPLELVDYVELDKYAVKSFNAINGTTFIPTDINNVDINGYGDLDLLIAGFPCQSISTAGKGEGFKKEDNTRSGLIWTTIEKLQQMTIKPKYILLENVKGLLSKKFAETYQIMQDEFDKLGYEWNQVLLNSKFFGVAQSRDRVYMLLNRKDWTKIDIESLVNHKQSPVVLRDILDYSLPTHKIQLSKCGHHKNFVSLPSKTGDTTNCSFNRAWKDHGTSGTLTAFTINHVCYNDNVSKISVKELIDNKHVFKENDKYYWRMSDGTKRECFKIKEPNKTINIPLTNHYTTNVFGTLNGVSPTLLAGGSKYVYFKNEMSQYKGKIIKLDTDKFNNQDPLKINKVATLGTIENEEFKNHTYNSTKDFHGTNGVSKTLTTEAFKGYSPKVMFTKLSRATKDHFIGDTGVSKTIDTRCDQEPKLIFKDHTFNQKKHWLGVNGVSKTLRAGDCDAENKVIFNDKYIIKEGDIIHYRKLSTLECWRLMGFNDESHLKCLESGVSNSQLAKQAGNSIVVNVLVQIFERLIT